MDALSVGPVVFPLPHILLSLSIAPESFSLHGSILEVSHVVLLAMGEEPSPVGPVVGEVSVVLRPVG